MAVLRDYAWEGKVQASLLEVGENITTYREGFPFIFIYPFTLVFVPSTDLVIEDLYKAHNSCLGQLGLNVWRSRTCLRFLVEKVRESFSLKHLIQIYLLKLYKGSILILASWYTCSLLSNAEDYSTENGRRGSLKYLPEKS